MISQVLPRLRFQAPHIRVSREPFDRAKRRFRGMRKLGQGAFGAAYSAKLGRAHVIVKTSEGTRGLISRVTSIRAMAHEINVLRKLQKFPFVPRLVEIGPDFFVQEDVEGVSMLDLLDRKGLEAREILSVTVALGIMASKIHREGVAHADLEPRNILLSPDGVVMIDFGVSLLRGKSAPEVVADARTFKQGMEKDLLSLLGMVSLVLASHTLPDNVRIILASTIEKFRRIVFARRVDEDTAADLSRDLIFALAQLGARARRRGVIEREKVKVVAE